MSFAAQASADPARPPLSEAEFHMFRDFLYDRSGLYFADSKKFLLENRLHKRLVSRGMSSTADYWALLRCPVRGPGELLELLDIATTHETSFFRSQPQLEAFRKIVLRRLLERRRASGNRTLQIWSAACSSGEEPYTLAMLILDELGAEAAQWRIRILGTDIARSMLEKAQAAVYNQYSFRGAPAHEVQRYFDVVGSDALRLKEAPRRMVTFQLLNFADDTRMRSMGGFQVVFCRNALIYFDVQAKKRFVAHFTRALEPGGFFFIGHSESLHGISDELKLIHLPGALAYQKPEAETQRRPATWNRTA